MQIERLDDLRIYYNTTIHPELMRMERLRRQLLILLFGSAAVIFLLLIAVLYLDIALLILLLLLPIVFYMGWLGYRIQRFRHAFKPRIVQLVLEFMNDAMNYRNLEYRAADSIPKELFLRSELFKTSARYYEGEDYIQGLVGETPFKLSELVVREISPASNKLQDIFTGVFLYSIFPEEDTAGHMAVWPRRRKQYLLRSIKEYTWNGGQNVDYEIMNPDFLDLFIVYATPDTHVAGLLPEPMQEALVDYVRHTGRDLYIAFHDREIFTAVSESRDLLEPGIFRSNLSFDLIREFYIDISLLLRLVQDFDQTH